METTTPTQFEEFSSLPRLDESRFAADARLYVEFHRKPVMISGKSQDAGRAIYEERDFIRIHVPGDKTSVVDRIATEQDKQRFADRYAKWKSGQADAIVGTPLTALPGMNPVKIEEYKFFKIVTVEQLADANDNLGQKFMSFHSDKQKAKAFLEVAAGNAPIEKMHAELAKRDEEIETLKAQMAALMANTKQRKVTAEPQEA
jgi:hypothetical protein